MNTVGGVSRTAKSTSRPKVFSRTAMAGGIAKTEKSSLAIPASRTIRTVGGESPTVWWTFTQQESIRMSLAGGIAEKGK